MALRTNARGPSIPGGVGVRDHVAALLGLLLGLLLLGTGVARLARTGFLLDTIGRWDLPRPVLLALGVVEIVAGTLCLVPATRARGALAALLLMLGAALGHLARDTPTRALLPLAAVLAAVAVLLLLRSRRGHPPPPQLG